ncbi:hypothetical protein ACHAXN_002979 [Cyclotella atomus]
MKEAVPISKPHSKERLELLANASKAGQRFYATGVQLRVLLKWQGLEVKKYKEENKATWDSFFADFDDWESLPNRATERWTAQDERELEALDDHSTITMNDTILQSKIDQKKRDLRMAASKMDETERAEIMAIFASHDRAESSAAAAVANSNETEDD